VEFGLDDAGPRSIQDTHASLRRRWIKKGAIWHSRRTPSPPFWNAWSQLLEAGFYGEIPYLNASITVQPSTMMQFNIPVENMLDTSFPVCTL
jgi:hypothetical protein